MLTVLLHTLICSLIFFGWSALLCRERPFLGLSTFLTILASLCYAVSLFIPVSEIPVRGIVLVGIFPGLFFLWRKRNQKLPSAKILFLSLFVLLLLSIPDAAGPYILDHFGYYIPTEKLIENLGTLRGIANLDLVYAQGSWWHYANVALQILPEGRVYWQAVFYIFFLAEMYRRRRYAVMLLSLVSLFFLSSPSPDFAGILLSLYFADWWLSGNKLYLRQMAVLSVFAVLIKPVYFWIPAVLFLYSAASRKYIPLAISVLGAGLFFFKNIWNFGYPVFPVSFPDLGFSWRPQEGVLAISRETGLRKTFDFVYTSAEIERMGFWERVYAWLSIGGVKSVLNGLILVFLILSSVLCVVKKDKRVRLLLILLVLKTLAVLFTSGQYRFVLDFVLVLPLVCMWLIADFRVWKLGFFSGLILISFIFIFPTALTKAVSSFRPGQFMNGVGKKELIIPRSYHLVRYKQLRINDFSVNVPKAYPYVFDLPQPALSPYTLKKYDSLRIFPVREKNGFRWKKISPSEQEKLSQFLSEYTGKSNP